MFNKITTIQEITLTAFDRGIFNIMQDEADMCRDDIFNLFEEWANEFEEAHEGFHWDGNYFDEIDSFIDRKFKEWKLQNLVVTIQFLVSENGKPVSGTTEYPLRDEDEDAQFEWYYSIAEHHYAVMALNVGESMNFKIRDDEKSHGVIIRVA